MKGALALACAAALALCAAPAQAATPWKLIGPPAPLQALAFAGPGSARVYAETRAGLWRSDDGGATWAETSATADSTGCTLHVSPIDSATVYSGCNWISNDAGAHWHYVASLTSTPQTDASGTLYVTDRFNRPDMIERCAPDDSACQPIVRDNAWTAVVDPASAGVLAQPAGTGGTLSTDGGSTWTAGTWPSGTLGGSVWFDGRVPRKLYVATQNVNENPLFAVSLNGGLTWGAAHAMPFAPGDVLTIGAGGSGAQRRVWIEGPHDAAWTTDDGVTFHVVHMPVGGTLSVDPNDGGHLFIGGPDLIYESHDAGATWALRNSPSFGHLKYQSFTGSGSTLYALADHIVWSSGDGGANWTPAAPLLDAQMNGVMASRDDPAVAYATGSTTTALGLWQTLDGGRTWAPRTPVPGTMAGPSVAWVESGHPQSIIGGVWGNEPYEFSSDGGGTWNVLPEDQLCIAGVNEILSSPPCGAFPVDPTRAPWDQNYVAAWGVLLDHTAGAGAMVTLDPLGRINADWSFTSACTTTKPTTFCPLVNYLSEAPYDAWAGGGHVTFANSDGQSVFAQRDGGRWWRLVPPAGSDPEVGPGLVVLLGNSDLVASGLLIPLQAPDVGVPVLSLVSGPLHCGVSLPSDAASLTYIWRRDGVVIGGATAADYTITPQDEGHALSCVATASNAWGATTAASGTYRVPVTGGGAAGRLALTGSARPGRLLRCGAAVRVSWLRDGHAIKGRHSRTYRVRAADQGHTLACQTRRTDGTLARSRAVHVLRVSAPPARGGQALEVTP